jgi:hypothetical protein
MADSASSLDARLTAWEARLDRLESVERPPVPRSEAPSDTNANGHLLFVPSPSGYELVEREGAFPSVGELLELEGHERRYTVTQIVRSPLPGDVRPCAYLSAI